MLRLKDRKLKEISLDAKKIEFPTLLKKNMLDSLYIQEVCIVDYTDSDDCCKVTVQLYVEKA